MGDRLYCRDFDCQFFPRHASFPWIIRDAIVDAWNMESPAEFLGITGRIGCM
jgi:hypothetical protein